MERDILNQEILHLDEIKGKINVQLEREKQLLDKQKGELIGERRKMWEECAHGVVDFDDIVDMASYDERVREEFGHYVRKDETVRQLSYLSKSPYFGRIDFKEDGEADTELIYIGRYGFCNKETYEYDVYDWRTPIASMFYDCGIGEASYKCPGGNIQGELTCKRQYKISEGEIIYCYDTNIAVQDDMLGEVLSGNTDKVLRVIIDTITKEQNHAIRRPENMDMLVMGPAGSGKTSVGMHRLAYLLYHNRTSLSSEKIVILSRNEIFSSYVSGILPELGEENVQDVLFDNLVYRGLPHEYKKKGYYEQVEYLLEQEQETLRKRCIHQKYSKEFLEYVREQLRYSKTNNKDVYVAMNVYRELLKDYGDNEVYEFTKTSLNRKKLYYEDILLLGYIRLLMGGIRPADQISQVVIDEAQDYCLVQLMILQLMYPKSRFTILADANQAVHPEISTQREEVFLQIFGKKMEVMKLSKSYRSTAPINRFAFGLLGILNPDLYINRSGKEPEVVCVEDMKTGIRDLLYCIPQDKSIGIITCDRDSLGDAKGQIREALKGEELKVQYIQKPNESLQERIVAMPIMFAKGLEFDVVIVWDDRDEEYWERHKNLKYLMSTRALHELYFLSE